MVAETSPYSNRPVKSEEPAESPIFWCGLCKLKLATPTLAVNHFSSSKHKGKVESASIGINAITICNKSNDDGVRKRGLDLEPHEGDTSVPKKSKIQPAKQNEADELYCSICNISLNSVVASKMHFSGKKHKIKVAAKDCVSMLPSSAFGEHKKTSLNQNVTPDDTNIGKSEITFCNICNMKLNSALQATQHYGGTKHKLKAGILSKPSDKGVAINRVNISSTLGRGAFMDTHKGTNVGNGGNGIAGLFEPRHNNQHGRFGVQMAGNTMQGHGSRPGLGSALGRPTRGLFQQRGSWSQRGHTLTRGSFSSNYNNKNIRGSNTSARGVNHMSRERGGTFNKKGLGKGNSMVKNTAVAKSGSEISVEKKSIIVAGQPKSVVCGSAGPASVPGAKKPLTEYFVNSSKNVSFIPQEAIESNHANKTSLVEDSLIKETTAPKSASPKSTSVPRIGGNGPASIPGAKKSLTEYFVNSNTSDHFKIDRAKKATVPGACKSLSDSFVHKGNKDFFRPKDLSTRNFYGKPKDSDYHHPYHNKESPMEPHYPEYYFGHASHPRKYHNGRSLYDSAVPPTDNTQDGEGNYYSPGYHRGGHSHYNHGFMN